MLASAALHLVLAALALVLPHRLATPRMSGSPRWALLIGAILVVWVATGDTNRDWVARLISAEAAAWVPNLYGELASLLPGLDAVRGVVRLSLGAYLACVVLAGLGAAALIRRGGRHASAVAVVLVLVVGLDILRAPAFGLERSYRWELQEIAPSAASLAFFDELERRGNRGPIFEVPVPARTSACFGSYVPPEQSLLAALAAKLPDREAVDSLIRLGFTTLLVHRGPAYMHGIDVQVDRALRTSNQIQPIHRTPELVAYALLPGNVAQ